LIWFVPESPRWLVNKGRDDEALKILAYYHADSNIDDPLVRFEYEEIKAAIEFDRTGELRFLILPQSISNLAGSCCQRWLEVLVLHQG
jgi:hypothetical protein